jgi:ligand-binding sensor domain-containing protein/signal transduction histidine kinase
MKFTLLFFIILCTVRVSGQTVFFNHISQEDGLRNGNVRAIVKDYQGFMWIGTEDGLHRYDGYEMKIYRYIKDDSSSLKGNFILSLFEDSHRNLWIGTLDGGLHRYNRKQDSFHRVTLPPRTDSTTSVAIRCIAEASDHYLYVGLDNLVRARIDSINKMAFSRVPLPTDTIRDPGIRISSLVSRPDSTLLVSVNTQGLFVYDFSREKSYPHEINSLERNIQTIYADKVRNLIWIGSWKNGLLIYDPIHKIHHRVVAGKDNHSLKSNFIASITSDASGNIWVASDKGISFFSSETDPLKSGPDITYLSEESDQSRIHGSVFKSVYVDNEDRVWIGSYYEGLNVYDKNSMNFGSLDVIPQQGEGSNTGNVNALQEGKDGELWIGLDGGGLHLLQKSVEDAGATIIPIVTSENIDKIKSLILDGDQNLWIGTWGNGLLIMDTQTKQCRKVNAAAMGADIDDEIISLAMDHDGNLLIGSFDKGLFRYNVKNKRMERIKGVVSNRNLIDRIHSILTDRSGNVWIGKDVGGLNLLNRNDQVYKTIRTAHLEESTTISTIFQDKNGTIWVGAPALGLIGYDPSTNKSNLYDEDNGLSNSSIYAIQEDGDGKIWVSHNAGLSAFDKKSGRFYNFTKNNGLTATQFNRNSVVKNKSGLIIFGNIRGITFFRPKDLQGKKTGTPIVFTRFLLNNTEQTVNGGTIRENITILKEVELEHSHNSFGIEFAALNYNFSHHPVYSYMLDGFDKTWQYAGSRRLVSYTNLEPGEYVFKVRANDTAGEPSVTRELSITITPAWWQTIFFKIALFISFLVLVFTAHRIRVRFLVQQRNRLEDEVRARTQKLNETIHEVNAVNSILHTKQEEIIQKNNEIQAQNEELVSQNDHIAEQHTKLAAAQQQLKEINLGLEKTVLERTETLQQTIDNLNKVVFELDRFVYSASHDLSAPLKSILGLVNIINKEPDPKKTKECAALIQAAVVKLDGVIKSMVEYAYNSHLQVKTEKIILRDLVTEIFKEMALMPEAAKIHFENATPENLSIQSDPLRLKLILGNLVNNCIKYVDKNKDVFWIRVEASVSGQLARIKISDNGIGIREEFIDKIFNMYFRATELSKGSGLGLFIVKETLSKIGGQITVESQIGEGTTFELVIPEFS